ncbi:LPP20 family lipoprotein [Vogesella amnigena]|uniref:LPP20 family lipoprotein n=1 Tax=Vogesella amnigena TaxID=1507449 RepID=A0ABV7TQD7_9NEIS
MKLTRLLPGLMAITALTACASTPGADAGQQWMVVAAAPGTAPGTQLEPAPGVAGSSEQLGIARQPMMTPGGVMMGGGYVGPLAEPAAPKPEQYNALRIRVVGRGAPPLGKDLSLVQRRLLAMRAAQLDAYRAMAEQVQGFKLSGNSSVGNLVTTNDSFRVYVDAYLRGVRLLSTEFKPDGSSESIAEVVLDEGFFKAYRTALATTGNVATAARVLPANDGSKLGCTDSGCVYGGDFYVSH